MSARASTQHLAVAMALVLALCLLSLSSSADRAQAVSTGALVPNQIIVKLNGSAQIGPINGQYGTRVDEVFLGDPSTRVYLLEKKRGKKRDLTVPRLLNLVERLRNDSRLLLAEPNFVAKAPENPRAGARHRAFPEDHAEPSRGNYSHPRFAYEDTALNLADVPANINGTDTTVAVLDTGAQLNHPDLKTNYVEENARRDFVGDDDKDPSEPPFARNKQRRNNEVVGHGTHVAGIVHLVAPEAAIMPLRVLNRQGRGSVFDIAEAIAFASEKGANVINLSLGTPDSSLLGLAPPQLLQEEVEEAVDGGAVVVAAAGNSDSEFKNYPAAQQEGLIDNDGILAVTSVKPNEVKSDFANYGTWVDISAPGERILSTFPVSRYAYWSGTSMATPFVAGQAALIIQKYADDAPDPGDVEEKVRRSARYDDFYAKNSGYRVLCKLGAGHTDIGISLGVKPDEELGLCGIP